MSNEVEIPSELVLPPPQNEREREIFLALLEHDQKLRVALEKINELLP